MKTIDVEVIMTTKNGVQLFFNEELGYLSLDPAAIRAALTEDMKSSDKIASKMARSIWIKAGLLGGIKNLSEVL
jgi:hypothetical protein